MTGVDRRRTRDLTLRILKPVHDQTLTHWTGTKDLLTIASPQTPQGSPPLEIRRLLRALRRSACLEMSDAYEGA
jgi:hypothetical protein